MTGTDVAEPTIMLPEERQVASRAAQDAATETLGDLLAFDAIVAWRELRTLADRQVTDAVRRARLQGLSWSQISAALDVSTQAAQQRYRKVDS